MPTSLAGSTGGHLDYADAARSTDFRDSGTVIGPSLRSFSVPRTRATAFKSGKGTRVRQSSRTTGRTDSARSSTKRETDRLIAELSGGDPLAARQAALRIGHLREARARVALEAALKSPEVGLRVGAASALGSLGRTESRTALESAVSDPDWRVRAQAAYALSRLHDHRSTRVLTETLSRDESALVRNACALALGRIGDPRAIPTLEHALDDPSDRVRREAVLALERSHDPDAAEKVRRFLRDPARRVRIAATLVIGLRRDREGVESLLDLLGRSHTFEKPALLIALGRIGTPECGEALAQSAEDDALWVRVCALHGLSEMRSPLTRRVGLSKLNDSSWAVRGAAALALGRAGHSSDSGALAPLLDDSSPWVRRGAVYALGQLGASEKLPDIRVRMDDPDPEVRLATIWALGRLRDQHSEAKLIQLLRTTRPQDTPPRSILMQGEGAVRLVSDAGARLFDALVQAVGSLAIGATDSAARGALAAVKRSLGNSELDRPARLPTPLGAGSDQRTLRSLFDSPELVE